MHFLHMYWHALLHGYVVFAILILSQLIYIILTKLTTVHLNVTICNLQLY